MPFALGPTRHALCTLPIAILIRNPKFKIRNH